MCFCFIIYINGCCVLFWGGSSVNSIDEILKCIDEIWIGSWAERIVAIGNRLCKGSGFLFYAFVLLWRL